MPIPIIRDLKVDRSALDRIIQSAGFISTHIGTAPEANAILIAKDAADAAFDAATCIGCGACVAACKNASAALFTGAKVTHLASLPQGLIERQQRVLEMVTAMDAEGFGSCTNTEACEAVCPQDISTDYIARMKLGIQPRSPEIVGKEELEASVSEPTPQVSKICEEDLRPARL